ncbi:MAG: NAD(+)/NADH kinase [Eubacteriales bacterium]|nr:NAD(+)/NADH kinase [Eubacteriales bacterium]
MQNVYLMMRQRLSDGAALFTRIMAALEAEGMTVCPEPWLQGGADDADACDAGTFPMDVVMSVGGDGTLLRATQVAIAHNVPIIGVNVGHIGFLVESELENLAEVCRSLKQDDFNVESRMMLDVVLQDGTVKTALNDVVISRGGYAGLITIKVSVGEEIIGRYVADGLIISTPSGSTGYSLSAGGPIICPDMDCMVLSPICPHSLQHRPVVAGAGQIVTIELDCEPEQTAQLDVDGRMVGTLSGREKVTICRSDTVTRLIRFGSHSFFQRIRAKLTEWSC